MNKFYFYFLIVVLFLNLVYAAGVEQFEAVNFRNDEFKKVAGLKNGNDLLSLEIKGVGEFREINNAYYFKAVENTEIMAGESGILYIPPSAIVKIGKYASSGEPRVFIELNEKTGGKLVIPEKFAADIKLLNKNWIPLQRGKKFELYVTDGSFELGNEPFEYIFNSNPKDTSFENDPIIERMKNGGSKLTIFPVTKIKISNDGFTGKFKIIDPNTNLPLNEIEGENIILSTNVIDTSLKGKNVLIFTEGFTRKDILGNVKYTDKVYGFVLNTKKGYVTINLNDIDFKGGEGEITRGILVGDNKKAVTFKIRDGKILSQTFFDDNFDAGVLETKEIFIRSENDWVRVKSDSIENLKVESQFDIVGKGFHVDVSKFSGSQLALYNSYLLKGFDSSLSYVMAERRIDIKKGLLFIESGFRNPFLIEDLIKLDGDFEDNFKKTKVFLDAGVVVYEILDLLKRNIILSDIQPYLDEGIKGGFIPLLNVKMPVDILRNYKVIFNERVKALDNTAVKWEFPEIYSNLYARGIKPENLKEYKELLLKLNLRNGRVGGYVPEVVEMIKYIPSKVIEEYIENDVLDVRDLVWLHRKNVKPEEAYKYKYKNEKGQGFYIYPGISDKDITKYTAIFGEIFISEDIPGEWIANLKALNINPKRLKQIVEKYDGAIYKWWDSEEGKKEINEWKKKRMDSLGLKEDRYSLPVLEMAYDNWNSKEAKKPIALAIYNRNDWNGGFKYDNDELISLKNSYHVIIFEASGNKEAEQVLRKVRLKFGKQPLKILAGHGSPRSINLGSVTEKMSKEEVDIDPNDLDFFYELRISSPSDRTGTVVLVACSTGKGDNSLGKTISHSSRVNVIAPTCDSNTRGWVFNKKGMVVDVVYNYGGAVTRVFEPPKGARVETFTAKLKN